MKLSLIQSNNPDTQKICNEKNSKNSKPRIFTKLTT